MDDVEFTRSEQHVYHILLQKSGMIVTRDEIAQSVWGERWLSKYSDWQIDRLIYLVRHKLPSGQSIKTLRNSGYVLEKDSIVIPKVTPQKVDGTIPTNSYLEYMNDPKKVRKTLKDLFSSLSQKIKASNILIINSYSVDNVDAALNYFGAKAEIYFTNFDNRAIKIHQERIENLGANNVHVIYDDIRKSVLRDSTFDLIINDFRLNFNSNHMQNVKAMENAYRLIKPGGFALISVVVDARFESLRYGTDQEKAPTNKDKPWTFMADEGLQRKCFTVPYYKRLFGKSGFKIVKEFDTEEGKIWFTKLKNYKKNHQPAYRRFLLKK